MNIIPSKVCSGCGVDKPLGEFYAHARDKHNSQCKSCWAQYQKLWRASRGAIKGAAVTVITCTRCGAEKSTSEFQRHKSTASGFLHQCRACRKAYMEEYYSRPGSRDKAERRARIGHVRRTYGLSELEFDLLMANGACEICGKGLSNRRQKHIDHDHATGVVRGVLCGGCNHMLGAAGDSAAVLRNAIEYLARHKKDLSQSGTPITVPVLESTPRAPEAVPDG